MTMPRKPNAWRPIRFIDEEIKPSFDRPPVLTKKPHVPSGFVWGDRRFRVSKLISSWFSYERKGRMARNMGDAHLRTARRRGSWGVGRYYFRVETDSGRAFDLYYDRAPQEAGDRAGHWFLWRELECD
jgi:hypothetical protein